VRRQHRHLRQRWHVESATYRI